MTLENLVRIRQLNLEPPDRFSICHEKRNFAEDEGHFETDEQLLSELIVSAKELLKFVKKLKF